MKFGVQKYRLSPKQLLESSACNASIITSTNSSPTLESSSFLVAMSFPKRGESSKKRKRRSDGCFYKKIAKLEKEKKTLKKSNATLRQRVHHMKKKKHKDINQVLTPRKSVSNILRRGGLSPGKTSKDIVKTLLFAEVVSEEIRAYVLERKNDGESIRGLLSGKILRKYKLIKYASEKIGNNRRKMCHSTSKNLNIQSKKRGFDPEIHAKC